MELGPQVKMARLEIYLERVYCPNDGRQLKRTSIMKFFGPTGMYEYKCDECEFSMVTDTYYPKQVNHEVEV